MDVGDKGTLLKGNHAIPKGSFNVGDKGTGIFYNGTTAAYSGAASVGDKVKMLTYNGQRRIIAQTSQEVWAEPFSVNIFSVFVDNDFIYLNSIGGSIYIRKYDHDLTLIDEATGGNIGDLRGMFRYSNILFFADWANWGDTVNKYNTVLSSFKTYNCSGGGSDICIAGGYAYLALYDNDYERLQKRTVNDFTLVADVTQARTGSTGQNGVTGTDSHIYWSSYGNNVVQKRSLTNLSLIDSVAVTAPSGMTTDGTSLYVSCNGSVKKYTCDGLDFVSEITSVGVYALGRIYDVFLFKGFLFIADYGNSRLFKIAAF